jgi:hypothetical protein
MSSTDTSRPQLDRAQRASFVTGALGLGLCVLFGLHNLDQLFRSYLVAFEFWISIPLGCIAILMLHHLTGGQWGFPIRRLLEAGTRTFLLMAALFVPVWYGMPHVYSWARPEDVSADQILQYKKPYLNPSSFTLRAVIYFAIWLVLAYFLNKWSREQDQTSDPKLSERCAAISGPGLVLWSLAVTFASVDWVMSLEPHWYSTIYGMIFMVVEALVGMSFVVFILRLISGEEPIKSNITPGQFNDLGNLMLTFVMLWAYLSFSQFLLIWAGNLKEEIPWYTARAYGGWGALAVVLIVLHFFAPFFLLLQRGVKRRLRSLSIIAGLLIALSLVDVYWLIAPAYEKTGPRVHPLDILALLGIGGIWLAAFFWELGKRPLLPERDPRFKGALEHGH